MGILVSIYQGLPDQWTQLLKGSAITAEDAAKNPQAVLDVLEFYTEQTKRDQDDYDSPTPPSPSNSTSRSSGERWAAMMHESKKSAAAPLPTPHRPAPPRPAPPPPSALSTRRPQPPDISDLSIGQQQPKSPISPSSRSPGVSPIFYLYHSQYIDN